MKPQGCAQVGPRGGRCRRLQEYALDFCAKHNQLVLDGKPQYCSKCNDVVDREERGYSKMSNSQRTFRLTEMEIADLSAVDLWARAEEITDGHAYLITIYDDMGMNPEAETAQALFSYGRLGIAWGADATWADVESLETGVEMWLNNPGEWDRG
jgi:hypothetical protein